ncbi:transporter substrate-binding domain-containing protein [Marinobacter halodurans]|uniref:Transporter substrate-binding domain-containing protein n=1 Tax=Marinobacter halodurans TaxID=2528979 RepID=A0ABY1ZTR0_9GAMM|nr:transporter substrate-binding domain-containing protein [Marinobacter halodurans]TBW58883.1 transporter substrate-binding domain-containing protein [Marinobacter halodurans]
MSLYRSVCSGVLAFLAATIVPLSACAADADPAGHPAIEIATGDWQPYVDSSLPDFGPMGHVIKLAFARAGYDVKFHVYPWTRNAQFVATGEQDAMMPYYCSAARARKYLCSLPIVDGEQVFFYRRGEDFAWDSMADLHGLTIGATLGYFYGRPFEQAEKSGQITVKRIAEDAGNIRLLAHGRIDLYPQDRAVGYGMIRAVLPRDQWGLITHDPHPLHRKSLHLLFSRKTGRGETLMVHFNTQLKAMRESGELDQLLEPIYEDQRAVHRARSASVGDEDSGAAE